jgi:hypothetical protein
MQVFSQTGFLKRTFSKVASFSEPSASVREVQPGSFIYYRSGAIDAQTCARIVSRFEEDARVKTSLVFPNVLSPRDRKATELNIAGLPDWEDLRKAFSASMNVTFSQLAPLIPLMLNPQIQYRDEGYTVQRTKPGEYYHWHIDYIHNSEYPRHFSVIWYLNDVEEGGETEFEYQKIKIRPKAGSMLVFPSYWTHRHRGVTPRSGTKYIATTWLSCRRLEY